MLQRLLELLPGVDFKRVTIISLAAGCSLLYAYVHEQNVELKEAGLVYQHPQVVTKIIRKKEVGPVRIVTRIIERPSGEKETVINETHEPVVETETTSSDTTPVPLSVGLAKPRTDRYLLTLGLNRLTPDFDGKAMFVGYGFQNRLDVQVGGVQHNGFSPWILATIRF